MIPKVFFWIGYGAFIMVAFIPATIAIGISVLVFRVWEKLTGRTRTPLGDWVSFGDLRFL